MKKTLLILLSIVISIVIVVSCAEEDKTLTFSDVTYVTEFPEHIKVVESTKIPLDLPGMIDIKLKDSLFFVVQRGQDRVIKVFSYPSLNFLGDFAQIGNGPGEFLYNPYFLYSSFNIQNDSLYLNIPDFKMKIVRYNVTAALSGDAGCFTQHPLELGGSALGVYSFDESTYYYMSLSQGMTSLTRHLIVDGEEQVLEAQEELNRARIELNDGYAFNLLSSRPVYNPKSGVIAECCMGANRINMYSVKDPSFKKTIVVGKKASSIKEAESRMKLIPDLPEYFHSVDAFPDFFAVLYGLPNSNSRSLLFFDWQGNPLERIDFPFKVASVEIDSEHRTLIAMKYETEELFLQKY